MTNLDRLNFLLAKILNARNSKFNVPAYARQVTNSGKNLQWLKKNLSKSTEPEITDEIKHLLNLQMPQLSKPYIEK